MMFKDPNVDILDCPALEVAKQLSLMEWRIWNAIKPYEFLNQNWKKKKGSAFNGAHIPCVSTNWLSLSDCQKIELYLLLDRNENLHC